MREPSPTVRRIAVHPIKALDPMTVEETTVVQTGSLEYDREYAIVDQDGDYVHGKRTPQAHRVRATYDFDTDRRRVTLRQQDATSSKTVDLLEAPEEAETWLSDFFDLQVELDRRPAGGYPDLMEYPSGPTLISTATLREVATWFPDITTDEARLRFRANIEIDGVPPFWEDRLYAATGEVAFEIGNVTVAGVQPTPRCAVPLRHPHTGEETDGFRARFITQRRQTYPDWGDRDAFDHFFNLMVNTHITDSEVGKTISVGDQLSIVDDPIPARTGLSTP